MKDDELLVTFPSAQGEYTHRDGPAAEYQPGEFYRRELPLLLSVLGMNPAEIVAGAIVTVDESGSRCRILPIR